MLLVRALLLACVLSGLVLVPSFLTGMLVGAMQAATSIQDQVLGFVPKLIVAALVLFFTSGWMLSELSDFTIELLESVAAPQRR